MGRRLLFLTVAAVAVCLALHGVPVAAEEKVYINGIDANFPPFAYVDKSGVPDGFDVKSLDWIAKEMGFKVKHQPMDWDGIIPSLKAKKIDMIASGMSVTEKRQKEVNFTVPYWKVSIVLVVPKDSTVTVDEVFAKGNKVGVQSGTPEADWIKKELVEKQKKDFKLVLYDSSPLAVEDVVNGRLVAAAMDDTPAHDAAKKRPVKILGTFGYPEDDFAYAVRREDTQLLNTLNEGLKRLMASPYWEELQRKYGLR